MQVIHGEQRCRYPDRDCPMMLIKRSQCRNPRSETKVLCFLMSSISDLPEGPPAKEISLHHWSSRLRRRMVLKQRHLSIAYWRYNFCSIHTDYNQDQLLTRFLRATASQWCPKGTSSLRVLHPNSGTSMDVVNCVLCHLTQASPISSLHLEILVYDAMDNPHSIKKPTLRLIQEKKDPRKSSPDKRTSGQRVRRCSRRFQRKAWIHFAVATGRRYGC